MTQSLNDESRKHIEQVAGEALAQLESIAETAKSKLHDGRTLGSDALASINTMTSSSAIQRLDQISQANRESYQVLVAEPAIARVVVVDEEGEEKTYCWATLAEAGCPSGRVQITSLMLRRLGISLRSVKVSAIFCCASTTAGVSGWAP